MSLTQHAFADFPVGKGALAALEQVRSHVPAMLGDDRWVYDDVEAVRCLVRDGELIGAVTAACGDMWESAT